MSELQKSLGLAIGLFLIFAGLLKLYSATRGMVYFQGVSGQFVLELLIIYTELLIGCFVVLRPTWKWVWGLLAVFFLLLFCVSAYDYYVGKANCGCLGVIRTQPLAMLILDVTFCVVSAVMFWLAKSDAKPSEVHRSQFGFVGMVSLLLLSFLGGACYFCVRFDFADRVAGRSVVVPEGAVVVFSPNKSDPGIRALLPVRNVLDRPIEIVGIDHPCKTVCDLEVPFELPPKSITYIPVRTKLDLPRKEGYLPLVLFSREFDHLRQPLLWRVKRRIQ